MNMFIDVPLQGIFNKYTYHIQPNYCPRRLGFSKLLEKLVVKYSPDKDYKER